MATQQKIRHLRFAGNQPMEFVESSDSVGTEPWSDAEEALAKTVGQATRGNRDSDHLLWVQGPKHRIPTIKCTKQAGDFAVGPMPAAF
jgi:hypothetical protein